MRENCRRFFVAVAISIVPCVAVAEESQLQSVSFDREIRPILRKCIGCHGPDAPKADLRLTDLPSAIEAGAIVPHDSASSSLIERVSSKDPEFRMPPDGVLNPSELKVLRRWINKGAPWPKHWAYRKLAKPKLPAIPNADPAVCRDNPIDRFVVAQLSRVNLTPSRRADRRTLLRRLYYDLVGIPPTADAMIRFQQDRRPDAYQRVVDRLLASPRHGERWARHWMDVVHFAETHGHDQDRPREHAWPYRDYLIRCFNHDLPYGRFVQEQIAGDVLFANDPWAIVATGFLAAGPWDESSLRDIQENSTDRQIGRYLDRDDIVNTVMSTFASTSVHCARCHHHKFDPITQDEYYGLQAVFAGIDKANRKYETDPEMTERRRQLLRQSKRITSWLESKDARLWDDEFQSAVAAWENDLRKTSSNWLPVELLEFASRADANLTKQEDNSIYADGPRPEKDTYTVLAKVHLPSVRAIRLAVLTDERLPMKGPGRQDNGNLHLNEIRVFSVATNDRKRQRQLTIKDARADFDQAGWDVKKAIDGNPGTAWGIHPEVGKSHYAVFELETPAQNSDGQSQAKNESTLLRIEMDQVHGAWHLIGRFELTATDDDGALSVNPSTPHEISLILRIDPTQRTDMQWLQLAAHLKQQQIQKKLAALPEPSLVYSGTNQFEADGTFRPANGPRVVHVLDRGEISKPLRPAKATTLSCVEGVKHDSPDFDSPSEADRRIGLAKWISSDDNGLIWRSMANRVWHYHFGKPLVDTPNDFGNAGSYPTHPELLDWLAATLRENSGSLKLLHRLIVTSATYQQASDHRIHAAEMDAANRWLWRMNRTRLDAESFRDSLLTISGTLDNRMGGPSDRQFNQRKGVHVTPVVDYQGFDVNHRSNYRRSVYRFIFRTVPDPFMDALDCPDASQLSPKRGESVTALQALATMNDKFVIRQCELVAERIMSECASTDDQVTAAFRRILIRNPTISELATVAEYVEKHGMANAVRLLLNTNEFMFVD